MAFPRILQRLFEKDGAGPKLRDDIIPWDSGTSGSADKLSTARKISLSGDATGSASFDGSKDVTIKATLGTSGATAGSYGPAKEETLAFGGSMTIPQVTVDAKGRVTNAENRTLKLPAAPEASTNAETASKLETAQNIDGVSFDGSTGITHYGTCSTAAATAAKTVALTGFKLVTGARVCVRFTVTNTAASPTLNVNKTGAKPVQYRNAAISAGYLAANRVYEFVYDGSSWELVGDINTDTNTDTKVTETVTTTDAEFPLLAAGTAALKETKTEGARFAAAVTMNPADGSITAKTFKGAMSGNASTADKLKTARSVQVNLASAKAADFDGSADVTPGVKGILPVANGGTGNNAGNASTADKLKTARTIRTNLASSGTVSFDGSANITPGVTGILPVANGGTGNKTGKAADSTKWNGAAKTVSSAEPSGGADGDIWFQYV